MDKTGMFGDTCKKEDGVVDLLPKGNCMQVKRISSTSTHITRLVSTSPDWSGCESYERKALIETEKYTHDGKTVREMGQSISDHFVVLCNQVSGYMRKKGLGSKWSWKNQECEIEGKYKEE